MSGRRYAVLRVTMTGWVRAAWALLAALLLAGLGAAPALAGAPMARASSLEGFSLVRLDQASRYDVTYAVHEDGSVDVEQKIDWTFPTGEERHGIYRTVQVRAGYKDSQTQYRYYTLSDVRVTSPTGAPTDVSISDFGAEKRIRIGSPTRTVSGTQSYVVAFHLQNVVNDIGDGTAEFYFDNISTSNEYVYQGVRATVKAPVAATRTACFWGSRGSTDTCTSTPGETSTFTSGDIAPRQGMSILASYPRSAFGDLTPDLREGSATSTSETKVSPRVGRAVGWLVGGLGALLPLLAAGLMGVMVWTRGRDEHFAGLTPGLTPGKDQGDVPVVRRSSPGTIAVQFNPPPGVQPGMLGTVLDEQANVVDVTATLIDLAVRGHLTLTAPQQESVWHRGDWILTRSTSPQDRTPLSAYEQYLLDGVFGQADVVHLDDLKNTFAPTLKRVQSMMYDEVVDRGWFRRSPESQRNGWMALGFVLALFSVMGAFFCASVFGSLMEWGLPISPLVLLGGGGVLAGGICFLLGRRMASRTAVGSAVLDQSLGFRQYMATAEANQIRWEEAQDLFSRYLPYAIVFGLTERWAKVFEQVARAATAAGHTVLMPTWYVGPWNMTTFDNIAADMDSFSTQAAGTFVSTPGSSGSSGFSTGGGFSGGGGVGGGGGSW